MCCCCWYVKVCTVIGCSGLAGRWIMLLLLLLLLFVLLCLLLLLLCVCSLWGNACAVLWRASSGVAGAAAVAAAVAAAAALRSIKGLCCLNAQLTRMQQLLPPLLLLLQHKLSDAGGYTRERREAVLRHERPAPTCAFL